jgi:hypothetical protein
MKKNHVLILALCILCASTLSAQTYVGLGMGLGNNPMKLDYTNGPAGAPEFSVDSAVFTQDYLDIPIVVTVDIRHHSGPLFFLAQAGIFVAEDRVDTDAQTSEVYTDEYGETETFYASDYGAARAEDVLLSASVGYEIPLYESKKQGERASMYASAGGGVLIPLTRRLYYAHATDIWPDRGVGAPEPEYNETVIVELEMPDMVPMLTFEAGFRAFFIGHHSMDLSLYFIRPLQNATGNPDDVYFTGGGDSLVQFSEDLNKRYGIKIAYAYSFF